MTIQIKEPVTAKTTIKISIDIDKVPDEIIVITPHALGHYEYTYTMQNCKSITANED